MSIVFGSLEAGIVRTADRELVRKSEHEEELLELPLRRWRVEYSYRVIEDGIVVVAARDRDEARDKAWDQLDLRPDADLQIGRITPIAAKD